MGKKKKCIKNVNIFILCIGYAKKQSRFDQSYQNAYLFVLALNFNEIS